MRFKTSQIAAEFYSDQFDARLRALLLELDGQIKRKFNHLDGLTITEILRTPEQQAKIYPQNPGKTSHHLSRPCRAVDFRNADLSKDVQEFLKAHCAQWWPEADYLENDRGKEFAHIHIELDQLPNKKGG